MDELKNDILIKSINHAPYQNGRTIIKLFSEQIYAMLPESTEQEVKTDLIGKTRWEVLFVDDDECNRNTLVEYFKRKNIVCNTASSAEDAFVTLKNDNPKKIKIVITDIRLIEKNNKWQLLQGYQILKHLNKEHPYPLGYFVLTSKKGTIIKNIQKNPSLQFNGLTKKMF